MIFTDTNNFIRFQLPQQGPGGDWYIRSVVADWDGNWWYLAFDTPVCPTIAKIHEPFVLTCVSEAEAHKTLMDYYTYHGAPELYSAAMPAIDIAESQKMNFI